MRTSLAILIGLIFAIAPVAAQTPSIPPTLKAVTAVDKAKGLINFRETVTMVVPVKKAVPENVNGTVVIREETVYEHVTVVREQSINVANGRVITPDGKQLPIEDVWRRVKANTVVAVSGSSATPADVYLRALNAETLIIIPPPQLDVLPAPPPPQPKMP